MAALEHFAATGYLPRVHTALPDQLIVMDRLAGRFVDRVMVDEELGESGRHRLGRELGQAVSLMVETPLPSPLKGEDLRLGHEIIPWSHDLVDAVQFYTGLCRRDRNQFASGNDPLYLGTLDLVEQQLERIPDQRQIILHEDFHYFAHDGQVAGIFDVEMCRLGTELMQLERVFLQCSPEGIPWESVLHGYSETTGRTLTEEDYIFMLAMAAFYFHIRITRWGRPNAEQDWVQHFLPGIRGAVRPYSAYLDLWSLLPHLQQAASVTDWRSARRRTRALPNRVPDYTHHHAYSGLQQRHSHIHITCEGVAPTTLRQTERVGEADSCRQAGR